MSEYKAGPLLSKINLPEDLRKNISNEELVHVSNELRQYIIDIVSEKGGHFGASLGVVELTVALHYVYNTPYDQLVWDVGHQAYGHKILTGRKDIFHTNRVYKGLSGFPKRSESEYDTFGVGHSSTSISGALGMAVASKIKGEKDRKSIAIIGDGAMTAGLAFEGLNHAGSLNNDLLVVLNDNCMSIDPNVGALKEYLTDITTSHTYNKVKDEVWNLLGKISKFGPNAQSIAQKIQDGVKSALLQQSNLFESLNFRYFGPIDGHDVEYMAKVLKDLKDIPGPKILHCVTKKGKGFQPAEDGSPTQWHAPGIFNKDTGEIVKAEQHAVTFSAGMATQGLIPFCNIYSSFMQRAYDQVIHDVAIQNLDVVFCLDRGGLVGADGPTHHGAYDLAFMRCIPNMIVSSPMNEEELRNLMFTAQEGHGPFSIRYPRGKGVMTEWKTPFKKVKIGTGRKVKAGEDIAVLTIGPIGNNALTACTSMAEKGISAAHYDMRFAKPIDEVLLHEVFSKFKKVITVEDGCIQGGMGSAVIEFMAENNYSAHVTRLGVPDKYIEHGTQSELYTECGYNTADIEKAIADMVTVGSKQMAI